MTYPHAMPDVRPVFEWLVDAAPGCVTSQDVVGALGDRLRGAGLPIDRMTIFVSTLHPTVHGRVFFWQPGEAVDVRELPHAFFSLPAFTNSPIHEVLTTRASVREHVAPGPGPRRYPFYDELADGGFTDYLALPMVFTSGETHGAAFATRRADGFSPDDVAALERIMRPLTRLAEIFALRRNAVNLLSTYVGHDSGERILSGRIRRGDIETLRAVIWFSDLRGFTEMSARSTARDVIDALNVAFECQVAAVLRGGGEVLKFMGDGMLAIFPFADDAALSATCDRALDAADEALAELADKSRERDGELRVGLALHVGELAYGNIGGADRLDFTAIGAAVNLTARLEGLTGKLGESVVVSREVAGATRRVCTSLGTFDLKGVPAPVEVLAPRAPRPGESATIEK